MAEQFLYPHLNHLNRYRKRPMMRGSPMARISVVRSMFGPGHTVR